MKKRILYPLLLLVFASAVGFIVIKDKTQKEGFMPLKDRTGALANAPEFASTKKKADDLFKTIEEKPLDTKAKLQLASIYIQEARVTGDLVYYDKAAMQLVNSVLKTDSLNFEALVFEGTIYLSQHHFAD